MAGVRTSQRLKSKRHTCTTSGGRTLVPVVKRLNSKEPSISTSSDPGAIKSDDDMKRPTDDSYCDSTTESTLHSTNTNDDTISNTQLHHVVHCRHGQPPISVQQGRKRKRRRKSPTLTVDLTKQRKKTMCAKAVDTVTSNTNRRRQTTTTLGKGHSTKTHDYNEARTRAVKSKSRRVLKTNVTSHDSVTLSDCVDVEVSSTDLIVQRVSDSVDGETNCCESSDAHVHGICTCTCSVPACVSGEIQSQSEAVVNSLEADQCCHQQIDPLSDSTSCMSIQHSTCTCVDAINSHSTCDDTCAKNRTLNITSCDEDTCTTTQSTELSECHSNNHEIEYPQPSTPQQKMARRLARQKQIRDMKVREAAFERQQRLLQRRGELVAVSRENVDGDSRKISWKEECDLVQVFVYSPTHDDDDVNPQDLPET